MSDLIVNKMEMAKLLSTSVPTLNRLLTTHGDAFPVKAKGYSGNDWQFDAPAVIAFLRQHEEAQKAAGADRSELMRQYLLPGIERLNPSATPQTMLLLAKLRQIERDEATHCQFLVEAAELRPLLANCLSTFQADMEQAHREILIDHHIPPAVIGVIEARMVAVHRKALASLAPLLGTAGCEKNDGPQPNFL